MGILVYSLLRAMQELKTSTAGGFTKSVVSWRALKFGCSPVELWLAPSLTLSLREAQSVPPVFESYTLKDHHLLNGFGTYLHNDSISGPPLGSSKP